MEQKIEDKVLGKKPEIQPEKKNAQNNLAENAIWEVSCDGCGKSFLNGLIVSEMLDAEAKKKARAGITEFKSGKFNFKISK